MSSGKAVLLLAVLGATLAADPILSVTKLHQNDGKWKDEKLDHSALTIGDFGCSLTVWTMALNYEISKLGLKDAGVPITYTPAEINKLLNDYRKTVPARAGQPEKVIDGWGIPLDADGKPTSATTDLNIGALRLAVEADTKKRSGTGLVMTRLPHSTGDPAEGTKVDKDYKPLKDAIEAGIPVPVRVNGQDGNGATRRNAHSVLVIGITDAGEWLIADPYDDPAKPIDKLSHPDYGNIIYSYMYGVFRAGGASSPYEAPAPIEISPADLLDLTLNPEQFGAAAFLANSQRNEVPEPASIGLAAAGLVLVAFIRLRARRGGGTRGRRIPFARALGV